MLVAMLLALAFACAGCSGINASHTVSPASFFLPGLMRNDVCTNSPTACPTILLTSVK